MDRDLERLAARHAAQPASPAAALEYALALRRAGDAARAFGVIHVTLEVVEDDALEAARSELLHEPVLPDLAPPRVIHHLGFGVRSLAWDANETRLAAVGHANQSDDSRGAVLVLDLAGDAQVRAATEITAHRWQPWQVAISADGATVAVQTREVVRTYDVLTGSRRRTISGPAYQGRALFLRAGEPGFGPPRISLESDIETALAEDPLGTGEAAFTPEGIRDRDFPNGTTRELTYEGEPPFRTAWGNGGRAFARAPHGAVLAMSQGYRWQAAGRRRVDCGLRVFVRETGQQYIFPTDHPVTTVSVSPGGRRLAVGTEAGEVMVLDLRAPGRAATPLGTVPLKPSPSAGVTDLRDPGPGPARAFRLLAEIAPGTLPLARPRLAFRGEDLWVIPDPRRRYGKVTVALGPTRFEELRVEKIGRRIPLATSEAEDLAAAEIGGVFRAIEVAPGGPVPPGNDPLVFPEPFPHAPAPPAYPQADKVRKPRWGRDLERFHDLRLSRWYPAPTGDLWALRARGRPRELWVVDATDPDGQGAHLICHHDLANVTWSPGGGRLAALLAEGTVAVFGPLED